ncbi:MAG: sigma-54-dependent Fis family transcriptional regulator [Verrucomicrobia bacterium]|nr:MAG: sigma-54-dependent Fis family transcriptional regulator [Verrucomicrobiota bacterium]
MAKHPPSNPPSILVADDQDDVLKSLRLLLKGEGYDVVCVDSPEKVLKRFKKRSFDVILIDLNYTRDTTSGQEGLDLIRDLLGYDESATIVVMTAWATIEVAVEAMRLGARDFVQKPWDNARLLTILSTQVALSCALRKGDRLENENRLLREQGKSSLLADSRAMQPVLDMIDRVGPSDANVLITGENGTGKGVVAQALHRRSDRSDRPFITVNMGGLSAGVFESELFGHVKGAFTDAKSDRAGRFELADGGTLFMDEIGNIPMEQQSKLLRLLETGEFERVGSSRTLQADVRILTATNSDLNKSVDDGSFRQDLLYRLNTIHLHLPPLRERGEDVQLLAEFFLERHREKYRKSIIGFGAAALKCLQTYDWPGNVRELDHAVERSVLLTRGSEIHPEDLNLRAGRNPTANLDEMSLEDVEKYLIQRTLTRHGGNATRTAEALGLSRSAFYRRLQRFGL